MFFNGLIRPLGIIEVEELQTYLHSVMKSVNPNNFTTKISLFGNSCWGILDRSFKDPKQSNVYIPPPPGYDKIVKEVLSRASPNLYPVMSQIAWIRPGDKVDKHIDLQRIYAKTRRFHVQLEQTIGAVMHVYRGTDAVPFRESVGAVYELNNRVYHSAENSGPGMYMILVIDAANIGDVFDEADNEVKDLNLQDSYNLPTIAWR